MKDVSVNLMEFEFEFLVFYATFSNISAISWRPDLVVEEAGVPGENHRPWASNWYEFDGLCDNIVYQNNRTYQN